MYDPNKILAWLEENVQSMRRSRAKTLAAITSGAMCLQGTGVLALGRAMQGGTAAKHRIKRVDRFLGNVQVEVQAVNEALFEQFCPKTGAVIVLADWTDRGDFQQLVLAFPCNGRAIPFYWITIEKGDGSGQHEGLMIEAEQMALDALERMCGDTIQPIIIADRGFGNSRWLEDIAKRGWLFVQRLACNRGVEVEGYIGSLSELGIRRGWRSRDWGWGTMGDKQWGPIRLVTVFDRDAKEPWYLVTNIAEEHPAKVVRLYKQRMWIEALFRDLKNRNTGLGMDHVRLTQTGRHDRHFLIVALAYILLFAFGAAAESAGLGEKLKANTVTERVLSLARIGNYFLQTAQIPIACAIAALLDLSG